MSGYVDANGAEIVTTTGATSAGASGSAALSAGGSQAVSGTVAVARRIDAATRRRVQTILLYEKVATAIPAALDPSPTFQVTDYLEALIYAIVFSGAGAPAGVVVTAQVGDVVNGLWVAHPQGVIAVNGSTAGPNAIFALGALTVLGDVMRVGIQASTPWTGGTVQLWAKLKG